MSKGRRSRKKKAETGEMKIKATPGKDVAENALDVKSPDSDSDSENSSADAQGAAAPPMSVPIPVAPPDAIKSKVAMPRIVGADQPLTPPPVVVEERKDDLPIRGEWQSVSGRDVAALLDPRPTLVVGSIGHRDEVGFATIIWATPISHSPEMVAFALRDRSHTMGCIKKSGCFSLNVLPATPEGIDVCEQCGTRTGYQFNKIVVVKHHNVEIEYDKVETIEVEVPRKGIFRHSSVEAEEQVSHIKGRVPVVNCATSWLACDVDHIEETGDHLLVIGRVVHAETCAVRDDEGRLIPQDVLECVQHGCYAKVELLDQE